MKNKPDLTRLSKRQLAYLRREYYSWRDELKDLETYNPIEETLISTRLRQITQETQGRALL